MSSGLDSVVSVGSFGLIDDFSGAKAAGKAARGAGDAQARASMAGVAEQRRQFDITQESFRPVIEAGNSARNQQMNYLGLNGVDEQKKAFDNFTASPGQQFLRNRAEKSLLRNASAIGGLGGGNVRTALQEQAVGLAQQDYGNQFSRLGAVAGQGNTAITNVGQFGASATNNISSGLADAGAARASGILGAQQARAQADGQLLQFGGAALGAFSDRRLKTDIEEAGRDELGGIYNFRYKNGNQLFRGRMADELQTTSPDDVFEHESGYLAVSAKFAPEAI